MKDSVSKKTPTSKVTRVPNKRVVLVARGATSMATEKLRPPTKAKSKYVAPVKVESSR